MTLAAETRGIHGAAPTSSVRARFAIARSRARRAVLLYLAERRSSYPSEIARGTAFTVTNVLGALVGVRERYHDGLSLVRLGLVAEETSGGDPIRSFTITDLGLALALELQRPSLSLGREAAVPAVLRYPM